MPGMIRRGGSAVAAIESEEPISTQGGTQQDEHRRARWQHAL
jgi:hypothetical protein